MKTEKCKICGTEIERKGPGCKPKYCDACRAERRRASQRKTYHKKEEQRKAQEAMHKLAPARSLSMNELLRELDQCALPGFVDSKNEEKTERNAGYLVVSQSGGGMLRQGTREGIRRTPANRGMRAHRIVKGLDISEDVCHGMCP